MDLEAMNYDDVSGQRCLHHILVAGCEGVPGVGGAVGGDLYYTVLYCTVQVGQLVETWPMALHYLSLAIVAVCAAIFAAANIIVRRSRNQR